MALAMWTKSLLTPCSKVRYFHVVPLALAMRTNPVLTPCEQGAVHFSPRPYAQYRWATRPQARCSTLPYNHQIRYQKCKKCRPENKYILTFRVPISPIRPPTWPEKFPQKPVEISLRHINFSTCFVKQWFFGPFSAKKEEKTPVFRAFSSSLGQR